MTAIDPGIALAQAAYAARPFACIIRGRFHSGTHRFDTIEQAYAYARQQYAVALEDVARFPSYDGILSDYRAKITGPEGEAFEVWAAYFGGAR